MATFGPQVTLARTAAVIGLAHNTLKQWFKRYGALPKRKPLLLTVPEVLALRVAVILAERHGFQLREAIAWSAKLAIPAFERVLKGERASATLTLFNSKTGTAITVDTNTVIAHVLPKLGLGFVRVERGLRPAAAELLSAAERIERYSQSAEFLARLKALHAEIAQSGRPMCITEAMAKLGFPAWVAQLAAVEILRPAIARDDGHVDARTLAAGLSRLTGRAPTLEAERR